MSYKLIFPKGFLWGTSTSSHQVEGGNLNDWREWEKKNAERLTQEAEKNYSWLPVWQEIKNQAQNPENYISGKTCDHYHLYEKDFDLIKSLNNNAYRFSIEWSRIEPEQGKFNQKEIEHYKKVLLALKKRKVVPFVTLYHWPIPLWLKEKNGWLNPQSPKYFERYAKKVMENLGKYADFWITINEPLVYGANSYLAGKWPPQKKNLFKIIKVIRNLVKAHKKAYKIIHQLDKKAKVSIAKNNVYFEPYKNKLFNKILAKIPDYLWNKYFLNSIKRQMDFIGLNYYSHNRIKIGWKKPRDWFNQNENKEVSDMGWEIYPKGIYRVLKELKNYKKPIYITENGIADAKDKKRAEFISQHLKWIHKAIQEGIDVRGYFYWSLLDNFEWDKGFWPRFGLIEIDYKTMKRNPRPSAFYYAKICKENQLILNSQF